MTTRRILSIFVFSTFLFLQGCAGFIAGCGRHGNVCGSIQLPGIPVQVAPVYVPPPPPPEEIVCMRDVYGRQECYRKTVPPPGSRLCENPNVGSGRGWGPPTYRPCREGDVLWNVDMSDIKLDVPVPQKQEPIKPFDL